MDKILKRVRIKSETADTGSLADIRHMPESKEAIGINLLVFFSYHNFLFLKFFCDLQALFAIRVLRQQSWRNIKKNFFFL